MIPGPNTYIEAGEGAPELPLTWHDKGWRAPSYEATRAYYLAGEGASCPVCGELSPQHETGCYEGPEPEPSYKKTSIDYEENT